MAFGVISSTSEVRGLLLCQVVKDQTTRLTWIQKESDAKIKQARAERARAKRQQKSAEEAVAKLNNAIKLLKSKLKKASETVANLREVTHFHHNDHVCNDSHHHQHPQTLNGNRMMVAEAREIVATRQKETKVSHQSFQQHSKCT